MITLKHDGFRKVREGITTIEEVFHIAGDSRTEAMTRRMRSREMPIMPRGLERT